MKCPKCGSEYQIGGTDVNGNVVCRACQLKALKISLLAEYEDIGTVNDFKDLKAGAENLNLKGDEILLKPFEVKGFVYDSEEYKQLKAENEQLKKRLENSVQLPCKVGDTVYAIAKCSDVPRKLAGIYYSTGWYCAFDGNEDKCPLCGEDNCNEKDYAIFETEVLDLNYCENSECNGWQIYLENLDTYESYYFTKSEAEARLAELKEIKK